MPAPAAGFNFPALRGKMGTRDYYVMLVPLSSVSMLLPEPKSDLPTEMRAQRKLNAKRVPEITKYILDNQDDWLFSSLTASFQTTEHFEASDKDPNMGMLHLPLNTRLLINDGQHRRAAIVAALNEDATIGSQSISVVLFPAEDNNRNQQMFSDLNRTVQKTSRSLDIAYDHRDPLNQITFSLIDRVPLLAGRVEKEAVSLAARSAKLITLSSLYDNLHEYLGQLPEQPSTHELEAIEDDAVDLWNELTHNCIPIWGDILRGDLKPSEARVESISVHSVFFYAIGGVGRELKAQGELNRLQALATVDFRRINPEWQGICMLGTDIVTRRQTRMALRQQLLFKVGAGDPPVTVLQLV